MAECVTSPFLEETIVLDDQEWSTFIELLEAPPRHIPALAELLARDPQWTDSQ